MVINKNTKMILTRSDKPNENWTTQDCYVVDDKSELAEKIVSNFPNIEYVIENDVVVDVVVLPKPDAEEVEPTAIEQLRADVDYIAVMTEVELI